MKLSPDATQALLQGDFYSPSIHPALVHAGQLVGCLMWQAFARTSPLSDFERSELDSALSLIQGDTAPLIMLQVSNVLSIYHFARKDFVEVNNKLAYASALVHRHNMRFSALSPLADFWNISALTAAPPEDAEAQICALSYHMYKSVVQHLAMGAPLSLNPDFLNEFGSVPVRDLALSHA